MLTSLQMMPSGGGIWKSERHWGQYDHASIDYVTTERIVSQADCLSA